jgi:hypothetical protein
LNLIVFPFSGYSPSEALVRATLLEQRQHDIPADNTTAITLVFEEDQAQPPHSEQEVVPVVRSRWLDFF